jgi:hypothetical protein
MSENAVELKELRIYRDFRKDPTTGDYAWCNVTSITAEDKTREFQCELPPDAAKRILGPIVDVLCDMLEAEAQEFRNNMLEQLKGAQQ